MRIISLIFAMIVLCWSPAFAGVEFSGCELGVQEVKDSYSDITFYHNTDALGNAQKASGSAVVTYDAGILLETSTPILGSGSWDNNNDGGDDCSFVLNGNLSVITGRIGFYFKMIENSDGSICWTTTSADGFKVAYQSSTNLYIAYRGASSNIAHGMSVGSTYFLEFKFSSNSVTFYVNNVSKGTVNGITPYSDTAMHFFSSDGNAFDSNIDQVICSSDPNRSLYAIRNITDFS